MHMTMSVVTIKIRVMIIIATIIFWLSVLLNVYSTVASLHVPSMAVTTILTGVSNM